MSVDKFTTILDSLATTEYSELAFSCLGHRFETQWQPLAEATTPSLIEKRKPCAPGKHEYTRLYNEGQNCINCGERRKEGE